MRRFYLPPECAAALTGEELTVEGAQARHMALVLRLGPGEAVEFFDGRGLVLQARLQHMTRDRISAVVAARHQEVGPPRHPRLILAQALLQGKKMDLLVQKANELGVYAMQPLVGRFCDRHGASDAVLARWQRIVIESCKQCRRAVPMALGPVLPPPALIEADFSWAALRLVAHMGNGGERQAELCTDMLQGGTEPVCLVIGPEGGLHRDELAYLQEQGFRSFSLGPRILRAETAALAAVAIVQHLSGALRPQI